MSLCKNPKPFWLSLPLLCPTLMHSGLLQYCTLYYTLLCLICAVKHTVPMAMARLYSESLICLPDGFLARTGSLPWVGLACLLDLMSKCSLRFGNSPFLSQFAALQCELKCHIKKKTYCSWCGRVIGDITKKKLCVTFLRSLSAFQLLSKMQNSPSLKHMAMIGTVVY